VHGTRRVAWQHVRPAAIEPSAAFHPPMSRTTHIGATATLANDDAAGSLHWNEKELRMRVAPPTRSGRSLCSAVLCLLCFTGVPGGGLWEFAKYTVQALILQAYSLNPKFSTRKHLSLPNFSFCFSFWGTSSPNLLYRGFSPGSHWPQTL